MWAGKRLIKKNNSSGFLFERAAATKVKVEMSSTLSAAPSGNRQGNQWHSKIVHSTCGFNSCVLFSVDLNQCADTWSFASPGNVYGVDASTFSMGHNWLFQ